MIVHDLLSPRQRVHTFRAVRADLDGLTIYVPTADAVAASIAVELESGTWDHWSLTPMAAAGGGVVPIPNAPTITQDARRVAIAGADLAGVAELALVAVASPGDTGIVTITVVLDLSKE